ncbi:unknown protein [Seminavis robusta]|uniref:Transmembrane protein n=1 Tax=Seminavis robusta TaxID=568900 RepID=A0A9N8EVR4_9STRA|nr:unknown protein [Seminavis robusta]|eukprot:Sro1964_g308230.1 n/a (403) ;mRNA; f:17285-18597
MNGEDPKSMIKEPKDNVFGVVSQAGAFTMASDKEPSPTLSGSVQRMAEERAAKEAARASMGRTSSAGTSGVSTSLPGAVLARSQQRQQNAKEARAAARGMENETKLALTANTTTPVLKRSEEDQATAGVDTTTSDKEPSPRLSGSVQQMAEERAAAIGIASASVATSTVPSKAVQLGLKGTEEAKAANQAANASCSWVDKATIHADVDATTAQSYQLSPQKDPLPEEAPLMTMNREAQEASSSADTGLNLVEATLVVEEMVEATVATPMEFHEDEVMKIREQSAEETARIRMWRIVVSIALLVTAIAVTTSTYFLLVEREDQTFRTVYAQFSTTVADAAVEFQSTLRRSLRSFADNVATQAETAGQGTSPWPFYIVNRWENMAHVCQASSHGSLRELGLPQQ